MDGTTNGSVTLVSAIEQGVTVIGEGMQMLTQAPAIYFVALALIGAGAGVARKFVPMRRR